MTEIPHADQVRSHARWRPEWSEGRARLAWLLPLAEHSALRGLVNQYQYGLRDLPGFDPVPLEWMHILLQEVSFADEADDAVVTRLLDSAREHLASLSPFNLMFRDGLVLPESLALPAQPQSSLTELRAAVRAASAEVCSGELPGEPEITDQHVSLAYASADGPSVFAVATLAGTAVDAATVEIPEVSLVKLTRDQTGSEWESVAAVPLGS